MSTKLRRQALPWQTLDGKTLILSSASKQVHQLNETGSWIWNQLEVERSSIDLCQQFIDEFDAPEEILKADLMDYLQELKQKGLIEFYE